jgi:UDP-glucose 4-epimerase
LRYAHLYGEGKVGHGAVGGFLSRMERGLAPTLYGGKQSNDFTYIKDVVTANILALETPNLNEIYNIGTGEETTTEEIFNIMRKVMNYEGEFEHFEQRGVDADKFVYDTSKAEKGLGFKAVWKIENGLRDYLTK